MADSKKPLAFLRNTLDIIREWLQRDILPRSVIRRVEETHFPKRIKQISYQLHATDTIIEQSIFLFD